MFRLVPKVLMTTCIIVMQQLTGDKTDFPIGDSMLEKKKTFPRSSLSARNESASCSLQWSRYIADKQYNQPICDIFPHILANTFKVDIVIINELSEKACIPKI